MRRTILVVGVVALLMGLLVPQAGAKQQVTHVAWSDVFVWEWEPGQLCEFGVYEDFVIEGNTVIFGDPENPTKTIDRWIITGTHTNTDTGYWLSDDDVYVVIWTPGTNTTKQVGFMWNLQTPDGERVYVAGGQWIMDASTGEVLSFTPAVGEGWPEIACPLLDNTL